MKNIIGNINHENSQYYFAISHYSKSFFTGMYYGSSGRWVNPIDFVTSISSPFIDDKLISFCLSLPASIINDNNHNLYKKLFEKYNKLNHIHTTSTVVHKFEGLIPFCTKGTDPVDLKRVKSNKFLLEILENKKYLKENIYSNNILSFLNDTTFQQRFIDFEAWMEFYHYN